MKLFSWNRAFSIAKKEVFHILRDPFTLAVALLLPVMMVGIFGLAMEFKVKNIRISVYDADYNQASRQFQETLKSTNYFIVENVKSAEVAISLMDSDKVRAALIIPPGFEREVFSGRGGRIQALVDGSDSSTIGSVLGYLISMQGVATQRITGLTLKPIISVKTRFLYNSELNSQWFSVPGLMVVVLSILSILLTSLTVAREWESGSMELLLSTPVQPYEIIIGKLSPYLALGLGSVAFVYVTARLFFHVPFRGNHFVFLLGCTLFLFAYLSMGLVISVVTRKQQVAMQVSVMAGLLPALLMSGFVFPIESMPTFFRYFSSILPARWLVQISRDVFLKGAGIADLKTAFFALTAAAVCLVILAAKKFKKDLEL